LLSQAISSIKQVKGALHSGVYLRLPSSVQALMTEEAMQQQQANMEQEEMDTFHQIQQRQPAVQARQGLV